MGKYKREKLREFVIKVGSMSGRFIGEHNLINMPVIEKLVDELEVILKESEG